MASLKQLNQALTVAGFNGCVSKAGGVYYLAGDDFANCTGETCLHRVRLNDLTPAYVLQEATRIYQTSVEYGRTKC